MVLWATPRNFAAWPSVSQSFSPPAGRRGSDAIPRIYPNVPVLYTWPDDLTSGSDGSSRISARRDVERPLQRDRRAGVRVVVERLPEGDAEEKEQQGDADADAPPHHRAAAAAAAAAFLPLDRGERRHGE